MRRLVWPALVFLAVACGTHEDESVNVRLGPALVFPRGVLDKVTRLTLRAYSTANPDVKVGCDQQTGLPTGDTTNPVTEKDLESEGCETDVRFCGQLIVTRAATPYVFVAAATNDADHLLASGCAQAAVDIPDLSLTITMHRYLAPAACGNGTVEAPETCDPPGQPDDSVCDSSCQTKEVYLSNGRGAGTSTQNGQAGDKQRPAIVWLNGQGKNGTALTFFSDKTPATDEITMRVRSDAFGRYGSNVEIADYSFFLPNTPGAPMPPKEAPFNQNAPAAVSVNGHIFVAFEDDSDGTIDIHLRSIDTSFVAEGTGSSIRVNGTESGQQTAPAIGVNDKGVLFIAWQNDAEGGTIHGVPYTPGAGTFGTAKLLSKGQGNRNVRVVGHGSGFLAVWDNGSQVRLARLNIDGTGNEENVGAPNRTGPVSHADVASIDGKRFAVVYSDRGDIFIQRYGADGKAIAGDQDNRVNGIVSDGDQYAPAMVAMSAAGGSYAITWLDGLNGDIRAAYLGGTGPYLFNPIDGGAGEFLASAPNSGRRRANPAIAVGGAGPYVGIVWEDTTSDAKAGIYGRRLPLPVE